MWRSFRIFLLGGVFGAICGIALGLFLFPFLFPPPEAMERLTGAEQATLIADGYPSVVIWCEQFSVLISPADLTFKPSS